MKKNKDKKGEISVDKSIRNKILSIVLIIFIASLALFVYNSFFGQEGVAGEKKVSIRIVIEDQDIDRSFSYISEDEFLYELLKDKEEELGVVFKEYDFGVMLVGLMDYRAAESNNEFFHISINGEDAMEGLQQIVLNDGDIYTFELKAW